MKPPILNQVAIWRSIPSQELDIRAYINYSYLENSIIKNSGMNKIYRYAKNYSFKDRNYCLIIVTTESDTKKIEKFLDETSKSIKEKQITGSLTYLDNMYK